MNITIEVTNRDGSVSIISYDKDNNKIIETTNGVVSDYTLHKQADSILLSKIEQIKQIKTSNYGEQTIINKVLNVLEKDQ